MGLAEYFGDLYIKATVPDPRTQEWPLIPTVWPTLIIIIIYLTVIIGGQKVMKNLPAFQLNGPMKFYNFCLVLMNAYIFCQIVYSSWLNSNFSKVCQSVEVGVNRSDVLADATWWFFISKSIELMDTVFFMLRKKNNQITFLHLYHHSTMPLIWWLGVKYAPGGEAYFSSSINSGVHILMYTYYLLSAMGPQYQKYLWWKRYMTVIQLIQFWAILLHTAYTIHVDCGYPILYCWSLIVYVFTHIALFTNFYYQTYSKKRSRSPAVKSESEQNGVATNQEYGDASVTENGLTRRTKGD